MPTSTSTASPVAANGDGRQFDVDCRLSYTLPAPTHLLFQIHALDGGDQRVVTEDLRLTPGTPHHVYLDPNVGNRFLRVEAEAGPLALRYRARVRIERPAPNLRAKELAIGELPDAVMHNLMPTRYCESDLLTSAALKMFGEHKTGYRRVQAISDWIHTHIDYRPGASDSTTTACDVFLRRAGVCRDFAHLGVTFCRALNIPARLVAGYARFDTPPTDFHAIFEAYLGGRWELFDPTHMSPPADMVRIAVGRDAKDVAFATIFGGAQMRTMDPRIEPVKARKTAARKSAR